MLIELSNATWLNPVDTHAVNGSALGWGMAYIYSLRMVENLCLYWITELMRKVRMERLWMIESHFGEISFVWELSKFAQMRYCSNIWKFTFWLLNLWFSKVLRINNMISCGWVLIWGRVPINPLSPSVDQPETSPYMYIIHTLSSKQVMRIFKHIR